MSCTNCGSEEQPIHQVSITALNADFFRDVLGNQPDGINDYTEDISHLGQLALGTNVPKAMLDVNGSVIFRQLDLLDFPANLPLGTAATTVDISSVIRIPQTTNGVTVTLPAPTNTQAGRLLYIENTGTQGITIDTTPLASGKLTAFVWSGTAWIPLSAAAGSSDDFWRSGDGTVKPDGTTDYTDVISHNANVGIGLSNPGTMVAARLDVNGAEILRPVLLANKTTNGGIGTAPTTVDIASVIQINQTTAGISATLPNPTNAQAGRLLFVENTGTQQIFVNNQPIPNQTGVPFVWSGTTWIPVAGASGLDFWRSGTAATLLTPDGVTDYTDQISHNANVGIGLADPSVVSAKLDVNGAEVLRPVTLANFAANAVIGTAAATVDIASIIRIPQTTQNIFLTLPNPTNAQAGRLLIILNTGTASVAITLPVVGAQKIYPSGSLILSWTGTAWLPNKSSPYVAPIVIAGNTTLEAVRHNFEILEYQGAANITITVPNTLPVGFHATFNQVGTGRINFVGSGGMVVSNRWSATQTAGQWAQCGISVRAVNSTILSGDVV